ncbi:MAG: ABC transporter permease [Candidatus Omnitrophota bacterium]
MNRKTTGRLKFNFSFLDITAVAMLVIYVGFIIALIAGDIFYLPMAKFIEIFKNRDILFAMKLSLITSTLSVILSLLFAVPIGYVLSRYQFAGKLLVDTIIDILIVLPPLVIGVSLLIFFRTPLGQAIEASGLHFVYTPLGIVLAQFIVASAFGVRAIKAAFDTIDKRLEDVARTLGFSKFKAFLKVTLPMARNGIIAGAVITWARAVGIFGPIMVFVGTTRLKTEILPTSIYLELSIGRIEEALAISMVMIIFSVITIALFKKLGGTVRI